MDAKVNVPAIVALTVGAEKHTYVHIKPLILTAVTAFFFGAGVGIWAWTVGFLAGAVQ